MYRLQDTRLTSKLPHPLVEQLNNIVPKGDLEQKRHCNWSWEIGHNLGTPSHRSSLCWEAWLGAFRVYQLSLFHRHAFLKMTLQDIRAFRGTTVLFWTSGDIYSGFQNQDGSPHLCISPPACYNFSDSPLSVTPADLLVTSMVAKSLTHIIFQAACVSRTHDISLSHLRVS